MMNRHTGLLKRSLGTALATRPSAAAVPVWAGRLQGLQQLRNVAAVPGEDKNNMGGPDGQEHYPASSPLRRRYAMTTMYGVLAASFVMLAAKMKGWNADPQVKYVLVHDNTKGELDDVKYIKVSDLPKS